MSFSATATVPTEHAAKYVQQVCRHWTHDLAVAFDDHRGEIVFPRDARGADWPADGRITLEAGPTVLACRIKASAEGQRDGLKGALARHIDRFAFREAPLPFNWIDS